MTFAELLRRAKEALAKEFAIELDTFAAQYSSDPMRVCKTCFKPGKDEPVYYAFEAEGACARCGQPTAPDESIGVLVLK